MKKLLSLIFAFSLITSNLFAGSLEIDYFENATDLAMQQAYVSNATGSYGNTGGTITTDGNYKVHTFLIGQTGTNFVACKSSNIAVLVVGGGGGGGGLQGGGGGAGGFFYNASYAVTAGNYNVVVGSGGTQAVWVSGGNGGNSSFGSISASIGGGGGGAIDSRNGADGGSGGGASKTGTSGVHTTGQGYDGGGVTGDVSAGGGGGGAGAVGGTGAGEIGGNGGAGLSSTIYDSSTKWYAAGGGGSGGDPGTGGTGGSGIGGNGTDLNGGNAYPGATNTGAGGGGSRQNTGGAGGSGIVIIRCLTSDFLAEPFLQSYSEATIKTQGSYALKAVAAITDSATKTLIKTFATNHNLTGVKNLWFDTRASRTGSNFKIGLHDTGGTTTEITPSIITADTYQKLNWDWSAVSDANKDNIDTCTITITNADSANTIYLDSHEIATCVDIFGMVN